MRLVPVLLALAIASPAYAADLVLRNKENGAELRLLESACVDPATLEQLKPEFHARFKAARALVRGKPYAGCWIEEGGAVFLLFENGEGLTAEMAQFTDPSV